MYLIFRFKDQTVRLQNFKNLPTPFETPSDTQYIKIKEPVDLIKTLLTKLKACRKLEIRQLDRGFSAFSDPPYRGKNMFSEKTH